MLSPPDRRANAIANALERACALDVEAMKPGNVGIARPAHGMQAEDFLRSAAAIRAPMTQAGSTVGERILGAVEATHATVGCNTNLGIVLLCAPLAHAALDAPSGARLDEQLVNVLRALDVADAEHAFAAIRLANPAGLGDAPEHDVRKPASTTLLGAMRAAEHHDTIAREYATDFTQVLGVRGLIAQLRRRWNNDPWVTSAVYLHLLANNPDTHIVRKHGMALALQVSHRAAALAQTLAQSAEPARLAPELASWDEELRNTGINPGTSADLTVGALFAARLTDLIESELMAGGQTSHPSSFQQREHSRILAN